MRSVTCSSCGFVSWAVGGECKQCGKPLPLDQSYQRPSPPPSYGYDEPHDYFGDPPKKQTGHAVASLILGIVGFFTFGILLVGSIVGTSLGVAALKRQSREPARYGGKGMAVAGLVMNIAALVMIVPISMVAAIAIPNLLAARQAANEASALRTIQVITTAEQTYQTQDAKGEYGELNELISDGLIHPDISAEEKNGYRFTLVNNDSDFEFSATPIGAAGRRSFLFTSEDWQIHARVGGLPATADDPALEFDSQPSSRRASQPNPYPPAYDPAN